MRARTILALALAVTACGGKAYQDSHAGAAGSNTGGSAGAASSTAASGSIASNPIGGSGTTFVTSGGASGSGVSSGVAESGTIFSSGSVASGTSTSGMVFSSGTVTSGAPTDAAAFCRVPAIDAGSLPFVVDTVYKPSGWIGDAPAYAVTPADPPAGIPPTGIAPPPGSTARISLLPVDYSSVGDACTPDGVGRSSANAKGACWKVTYIPFPKPLEPGSTPGTMKIGTGPGYGWAGVLWQYPLNNFGNLGGGYPIPPGATTISFWARGTVGREKVQFVSGEGQGGLIIFAAACSDYVATNVTNATFPATPTWVHYAIPIAGLDYSAADIIPGQGPGYFGGVLAAFGFNVEDQTLPSLDGGSAPPTETDLDGGLVVDPYVPDASFPPFFDSTITFYIDDIEFQ
jgi:hypothetical protein